MANHSFLLPELIDAVFQHLPKWDLYRCSQVNREFNAHAIPFLYRVVEFYFHAPYLQQNAKTKENKVWRQFCRYPELLSYVHEILVEVIHNQYQIQDNIQIDVETTPCFEKRVEYILRQGRNVRTVKMRDFNRRVPQLGASHHLVEFGGHLVGLDVRMTRAAEHIFNVLADLEGYREITLDLWNVKPQHIRLDGDQDILLRLQDKSQVVNLSTTGFDSPSKCLLLQQFSKLHRLCLRDHIDTPTSETLDFETIFENTPLEYLQINVSNIESLPRTIQELRVGCDRVGKTLTQKTWQAVSRLRHLNDLAATHERMETWLPFAFESANLQSVTLSFTWEPADRFDQQILEPMLASSKSLRSVAISPQLLSASTLKLFSKSDSAQSITVLNISSHYTKFNFEDLVVSLRNLPRLETLTLPWPINFSTYPSTVQTDSASPVPESASADFDQPHVLHFSHCEAIAVSCPNLTEIHFFVEPDVPSEEDDYHIFREAEEEETDTDEDDDISPFDPQNFDAENDPDQWFRVKRSQSFKNGRLVSVADSPCLHVCTVFSDTCDAGFDHAIRLFVLLNQVRKHTGFL